MGFDPAEFNELFHTELDAVTGQKEDAKKFLDAYEKVHQFEYQEHVDKNNVLIKKVPKTELMCMVLYFELIYKNKLHNDYFEGDNLN